LNISAKNHQNRSP